MTVRRILIALLLVVAAGLGVFALRPPVPAVVVATAPAPPAPATGRMIVAARALTPGTLIIETDMTAAEVPLPLPADAIEATPSGIGDFRGALVRRFMARGAPITREDIMHPGERGFLGAVLRPGHRAITIGVDAITGAGGLVAPGDLVDLVLVQTFADVQAARRITAETVLTLLRVIAVDQQVAQGAGGSTGRIARTVTLEVTPDGAERVAVAEQLGRLALTVRSAQEATEAERSGAAVYGGDVSNALGNTFVPPPPRMRVFQGGDTQEFTFR
jgi:pilus assembly protein CpaB